MRKRESRIRRRLHRINEGGNGNSWAARQASRRSGRRKKTVKSGYEYRG